MLTLAWSSKCSRALCSRTEQLAAVDSPSPLCSGCWRRFKWGFYNSHAGFTPPPPVSWLWRILSPMFMNMLCTQGGLNALFLWCLPESLISFIWSPYWYTFVCPINSLLFYIAGEWEKEVLCDQKRHISPTLSLWVALISMKKPHDAPSKRCPHKNLINWSDWIGPYASIPPQQWAPQSFVCVKTKAGTALQNQPVSCALTHSRHAQRPGYVGRKAAGRKCWSESMGNEMAFKNQWEYQTALCSALQSLERNIEKPLNLR